MKVVVNKREGFVYGGEYRSYGQVLDTMGLPNDPKMIEIGYFVKFDPDVHGPESELHSDNGRYWTHESFKLEWLQEMEERTRPREESMAKKLLRLSPEEYRQYEEQELRSRGFKDVRIT